MTTELHKGDILQCAEGHDMYEMTQDAGSGDIIAAISMKACAGLPEPEIEQPMPRCPICGGLCVAYDDDGLLKPVRVKRV